MAEPKIPECGSDNKGYSFVCKETAPKQIAMTEEMQKELAEALGSGFLEGMWEETRSAPLLDGELENTVAWKCRHLLPKAARMLSTILKTKVLCCVFSNGTLVPLLPMECQVNAQPKVQDYAKLTGLYESGCFPFYHFVITDPKTGKIMLDKETIRKLGYSLTTNFRWALFKTSSQYAKGYAPGMFKFAYDGYPYPKEKKCDTHLYPIKLGKNLEVKKGFLICWPNRDTLTGNVVDLDALNVYVSNLLCKSNEQAMEWARDLANNRAISYHRADSCLPVPVAMIDLAREVHWELHPNIAKIVSEVVPTPPPVIAGSASLAINQEIKADSKASKISVLDVNTVD